MESLIREQYNDVIVCIEVVDGVENYTEQTIKDIASYYEMLKAGKVQQINWDVEINADLIPFIRSATVIF